MKKAIATLCFLLCAIAVKSQLRIEGYNTPWAGGLNACQFGQIDLNGDGKNDLVVFDRHGNRVLTYQNEGGHDEISYSYHPEYQRYFPKIDDWLILADYDNDGHNDIFTYSNGWAGIKVYRNTGEIPLSFELVKAPYLTSLQDGGEVNILATNSDYPALIDLDGDGDLDILTFWVLGTFIEKHQNMSMERYGHSDSLVFEKKDQCWGMIAESEEDNAIYLDTCLFGNTFYTDGNSTRHRGATFAMRDIDGNGLLDLLLGDVDYPTLTLLLNDGSTQSPVIVSQTDAFPEHSPINLFSMPLPFFGDINNDGLTDMVVSPFDPNGLSCEGINSVWLYLNKGSEMHPDFRLHTKSFLQNDMIDVGTGAYPHFCDIDNDGKTDLLVGTIGNIDSTYYYYGSLKTRRKAQITSFLNIGSASNTALQLSNKDLGGLSMLETTYLTPTSALIDGKKIFLFGTASGNLILTDSEFNIIDANYLNFTLPYSAPCLFDVNNDGITDLAVGHQDGKISFYIGYISQGKTCFELISHNWGGIDVRDYNTSFFGYSTPYIFNQGDEKLLIVGSEQGKLFLFKNISDDGTSLFDDASDSLDELFQNFENRFGYMSAPAVGDIDNDNELELVVGNFSGGLQLFNSDIEVYFSIAQHDAVEFTITPNPAHDKIHICNAQDEKYNITICDLSGHTLISQRCDSHEADINIDELQSGVYLVTVVGDKSATIKKMIKE